MSFSFFNCGVKVLTTLILVATIIMLFHFPIQKLYKKNKIVEYQYCHIDHLFYYKPLEKFIKLCVLMTYLPI